MNKDKGGLSQRTDVLTTLRLHQMQFETATYVTGLEKRVVEPVSAYPHIGKRKMFIPITHQRTCIAVACLCSPNSESLKSCR